MKRFLVAGIVFILLCASPAWAGPEILWFAAQPANGPFTTEVTGTFSIPISWYQDATATTQGSLAVLLGGGGGGDGATPGYAGDKVTLTLTPGSRYAYKGFGGEAAGTGEGALGGGGYVVGGYGGSVGAGGGSSAIASSLGGTLIAQSKGGNGNTGVLGGGTSSGGTVAAGGANNGGLPNGGNGGVFLTYYTDPGNFQFSGFETGNDGWTFSGTAVAARTSGTAHTGTYFADLYEESYNTNEYSVQKTLTTRAGVMSAWIYISAGNDTDPTKFHVSVGGTTYDLAVMGGYNQFKYTIPAGSTTIKFWFTGNAGNHYEMRIDDISIPVP